MHSGSLSHSLSGIFVHAPSATCQVVKFTFLCGTVRLRGTGKISNKNRKTTLVDSQPPVRGWAVHLSLLHLCHIDKQAGPRWRNIWRHHGALSGRRGQLQWGYLVKVYITDTRPSLDLRLRQLHNCGGRSCT